MGLIFRRSRRVGRTGRISVSNRGVSAGLRLGPVSISSTGHLTIRLGKGLSFRIF